MNNRLTQERLKELLSYNPDTGLFTWNKPGLGRRSNGVAGNTQPGEYTKIKIDYVLYTASRLAFLYMEGYFPEHQVDHINRNRSDNRWVNLRHVTQTCNTINSTMRSDNTTGITGVYWYKKDKRWVSIIGIDGKNKYIGSFTDIKDAVLARWKAEVKHAFPNCNTTSAAYLYLKESHCL